MDDRGATSGAGSIGQGFSATTSPSMYDRGGPEGGSGEGGFLRASSSTEPSAGSDVLAGSSSSPPGNFPPSTGGSYGPPSWPQRRGQPLSFLELLRLLPDEDQRGVMRIERQGRIAGFFTGAATGTWVYRALKRRGTALTPDTRSYVRFRHFISVCGCRRTLDFLGGPPRSLSGACDVY